MLLSELGAWSETIGNTSIRSRNRLETRLLEGSILVIRMRGKTLMKYSILAVLVAGAALAVAAISTDADQHKGGGAQDRDRDQSHAGIQDTDRLHDRERIQLPDPSRLKDEDIYGHKLMSPEELKQYRERLRLLKTEEERLRFKSQHREKIQKRAEALQIEIEDAE
jgi:hypothetical protein